MEDRSFAAFVRSVAQTRQRVVARDVGIAVATAAATCVSLAFLSHTTRESPILIRLPRDAARATPLLSRDSLCCYTDKRGEKSGG
jgi:hypothetical protein